MTARTSPRKALAIRWIKFNGVGALGIVVQMAALALYKGVLGAGYLLATGLAVETAVLHNFVWHERFTWSDRASLTPRKWLMRLVRFNLTTGVISIAGNLLLMRLFSGQLHVPVLLSNLLAIATCSLANFVVSHLLVFRSAKSVNDSGF